MSAWLAARKLLQDKCAAAEALLVREMGEREQPAKDPTPIGDTPGTEVPSVDEPFNVWPATTSAITSAASAVDAPTCTIAAAADIDASTAITVAAGSVAFESRANSAAVASIAASAAESFDVLEEAVAAVPFSTSFNDEYFDTSANRSRRWRYENVLKARDHNVNGQERRKKREQLDPKLRERRREQVRECKQRDREAARRFGLKPSDPRWKQIKAERWQCKQKQAQKLAHAEVNYFYSEDYMICKRARQGACEQLAYHHDLSRANSSLLCAEANAHAAVDADVSEALLALPAPNDV